MITAVTSVAFIVLTIIAGAVLYTSLIEIPVRQQKNPEGQLNNWQLVFPRASGLLKTSGILLAPLLILSGYLSGNILWYVSFACLMVVQPFTAMFVTKTNNTLVALSAESDRAQIVSLIQTWDRLHHMRTAMIMSSMLIAATALFYTT